MNYSKKGLKKNQKALNSRAPKNVHKLIISLAGIICVCALGGVIVGASAVIGIFDACIDTAPEVSASDIVASGQSSFVYD
ncbi:MAG: hypothetical protein LUH19_08545, partial [Lachnospiraceae bacterium]|nr:hypothetical protein [Lachnospiraceae bacterium]